MANTLKLLRNGAARRVLLFTLVGFIDWLDGSRNSSKDDEKNRFTEYKESCNKIRIHPQQVRRVALVRKIISVDCVCYVRTQGRKPHENRGHR